MRAVESLRAVRMRMGVASMARLGAHGAHQLVAAHLGHHEVAHDEVGLERAGQLEALAPVEGGVDPERVGQRLADEPVHVLVVLDHQDERRRRRRPSSGGRWARAGRPAAVEPAPSAAAPTTTSSARQHGGARRRQQRELDDERAPRLRARWPRRCCRRAARPARGRCAGRGRCRQSAAWTSRRAGGSARRPRRAGRARCPARCRPPPPGRRRRRGRVAQLDPDRAVRSA